MRQSGRFQLDQTGLHGGLDRGPQFRVGIKQPVEIVGIQIQQLALGQGGLEALVRLIEKL